MARSFPKDCVRGRVRRLGLLGSGGQLHTGEVRASSGRIAESSSHFFLATVFFLKSTLKKKANLLRMVRHGVWWATPTAAAWRCAGAWRGLVGFTSSFRGALCAGVPRAVSVRLRRVEGNPPELAGDLLALSVRATG